MIYKADDTKNRAQWANELKNTEYKHFRHPRICKKEHDNVFSVTEGGKCVQCVKLKEMRRYAKKQGLSIEEYCAKQEAEAQRRHDAKIAAMYDKAVKEFHAKTKAEEQEPIYHAIYALTNSQANKVYIGSSNNPKQRSIQHSSGLRTGKHHVPEINADVTKYGLGSFEFSILCAFPSDTDSDVKYAIERLYISNWKGEMYNTRLR